MARKGALLALIVAAASAAILALRSNDDRSAPLERSERSERSERAPVSIDARRQQLIGVRTARAERRRLAIDVRATGTVTFDETKETEINSKVDGWVRDLKANYTGMPVRKGDPLFTLYSPELLATENEFIIALRSQQQAQQSTLPETRDHAERLLQAVRERLMFWDVSIAEIREMERRGRALGVTSFVSPASGVIVEKAVIEGMRIMAGQRLFRLADLSSVWVEADVYERDLAAVRVGQAASVTLDAYPGETFNGRVSYLHSSIAEQTRTLKVRIQLDNPRGRLRPGMYANVTIAGPAAAALVVPADAVVDSGTEQVVFVTQGDGYFDPRPVTIGRRFADTIEIVRGLEDGDTVASGATFFLDSESQLRGALQNYQASPSATGGRRRPAPGHHLPHTARSPAHGRRHVRSHRQGRGRTACDQCRRVGGALHAGDAVDEPSGHAKRSQADARRRRHLPRHGTGDDGRPLGRHRHRHPGRSNLGHPPVRPGRDMTGVRPRFDRATRPV